MADSSNYSVMNAIKPDGFVDFYELLNESPDVGTEQIRTRITELHNEAQANRDHRNLARRHEYQMLLELLPQCRAVLLDERKRQRYDEYAAQARSGAAPTTFDVFMDEITGKVNAQGTSGTDTLSIREGALGMRDMPAAQPRDTFSMQAHTHAVRTPVNAARSAPAPGAPAPGSAGFERLPRNARISLMGSAVSVAVFCGVFILARFLLKTDVEPSILIAGICGVVIWIVTHRGGTKG